MIMHVLLRGTQKKHGLSIKENVLKAGRGPTNIKEINEKIIIWVALTS